MFAQSMVCEPLVKISAGWFGQAVAGEQLEPLCRRGRVWLFTLRNDVQFSNGEPFNAQAAVASFGRCWLTGSAMLAGADQPDYRRTGAQRYAAADYAQSACYPFLQGWRCRPFPFIAPSQFVEGNFTRYQSADRPWVLKTSQLNQYDVLRGVTTATGVTNRRSAGDRESDSGPDDPRRRFWKPAISICFTAAGLLPLDTFARFSHAKPGTAYPALSLSNGDAGPELRQSSH